MATDHQKNNMMLEKSRDLPRAFWQECALHSIRQYAGREALTANQKVRSAAGPHLPFGASRALIKGEVMLPLKRPAPVSSLTPSLPSYIYTISSRRGGLSPPAVVGKLNGKQGEGKARR